MQELIDSTHLNPYLALTLSSFSLAVVIWSVLWLFLSRGGRGLFRWGPQTWKIPLLLAGVLPLLLALLALTPLSPALQRGLSFAGAVLGVFAALTLGASAWRRHQLIQKFTPPLGPRLLNVKQGLKVPGDWCLMVTSDPHLDATTSDTGATMALLRRATQIPVQALLILGDFVEQGLGGWGLTLKILREGLGTSVPLLPLLGNHDALFGGDKLFLKAFPLQPTTSGSPWYYTWDVVSSTSVRVRFFVLHLLWGTETFGTAQRLWLEQALAETPPGFVKVALSHCFFASSGWTNARGRTWFDHPETLAEVAPVLEAGGVSLVISGHQHQLEELSCRGIRYVVVGSAGAVAPPITTESPYSLWRSRRNKGALLLRGTAQGLELVFEDEFGKELHRSRLDLVQPGYPPPQI